MSGVEVSTEYGGRLLTLQTGKIAKQTDAAVFCRYGDTIVLVTVVSNTNLRAEQDFFPLTVDFQEKYYSAGRLPGGFFKREARPSEVATLSARIIDRPCRPLFPDDYMYETHIVATVLSTDGINDPDVLALIGASSALYISDIPWQGPVACCRIGWVNDEFVLNIRHENSLVDLLVAGGRSGVVMVEGGAKEVSEPRLVDAIDFAHVKMQPILDLQEELRQKVGRPKRDYQKPPQDERLKKELETYLKPHFERAFAIREKLARYEAMEKLKDEAVARVGVADPKTTEDQVKNTLAARYFEELKAGFARETTLRTQHRIDGRAYNEIRPISCETGLLPRVHGSALFTRGETQVLAAVTLGTSEDEQKVDSISGVYQKTFMLHYNFPPFSVGEAKPLRAPGRREIGHGNLAERALALMVPPKDQFPYTVRVVAEVLESNGSSSMATVCSGSLALMDAGVPVKKAVAGVAMGLIKEGEAVAVLSDILGDEDHLGDMDFKVCGTAEGVTAFQMDLKIGSVNRAIMEMALAQAKEGRLHVLSEMNRVLATSRADFSPYAPRIVTMKVKPHKVREVIGSGGKVIRGIIEQTGVKIDIEDDGTILIASSDESASRKAMEIISRIIEEAEIGKVYEGTVVRITDFGAFVEIIPGTDGLVHISELEHHRVQRVEDVVREGDTIQVKCLDVDTNGKIRLSRKALLTRDSGGSTQPNSPSSPHSKGGQDRQDRGGGGGGDRGYRRQGRSDRGDRGGGGGYRREGGSDRDDRGDRGEDRGGNPGNRREERGAHREAPRDDSRRDSPDSRNSQRPVQDRERRPSEFPRFRNRTEDDDY